MSELEGQGLTRREMLRKGVITGGAALAWAAPVVTTIGINRAMAATTSAVGTTTTTTTAPPNGCTPGISYIAINFDCGSGTKYSKFDGSWSGGAGQVTSQCPGISVSNGVDAGDLGFSVDLETGLVTVPEGCTVSVVAVKGGQLCSVKYVGWTDGTFQAGCPSDSSGES